MSKPKVSQQDIDLILSVLSHGRWMKGRHMCKIPGVKARMIRAVAEHTGKVISGQKGYKLTDAATGGELEAARNDLESRANHLFDRARKISAEIGKRFAFSQESPSPGNGSEPTRKLGPSAGGGGVIWNEERNEWIPK